MTQSSHAASLAQKHAKLDEMITLERQRPLPDDLQLQEWKKEKLRLKQELESLTRH